MTSPVLGEFMGTLILVLLGNGVVANANLRRSKAEGAGWMVITAGWGFGVMFGVFVALACGSADAHLNPAVTLASAITTGSTAKILPYWAAQAAGAFLGGVLVWLYFLPHWGLTPDQGVKLACFGTGPAVRKLPANLLCEIIATFVLVLVINAIFSKRVAATGPVAGLGPSLIGAVVWGIGMSLGGTTGYAMNPARDLGPRIAHALLPIAGKGDSDWGYAWVPIVGPLAGAALAAVLSLSVGL